MQIDEQILERLSNLELELYAGKLDAIKGEDRELFNKLVEHPVEVRVIAPKENFEEKLYQICLEVQGRYNSFNELRRRITFKLLEIADLQDFQVPGWNLLSVLFAGIYMGEPEDLLNYRKGRGEGILYRVKGLGTKVAEVRFIGLENS